MSILPEFLLTSYDSLCESRIVKHKEVDTESIEEFISILNEAIPKKYTPEYTIYLFNRTKYKINRWKFIKDITDSPYKSMILWTNYKEILRHFDLVQQFYLKWDKELNLYAGDSYDPSKHIKEVISENDKKEKNEEKSSDDNDQVKAEEYMDDQDRLLDYIQKRKKELNESNQN